MLSPKPAVKKRLSVDLSWDLDLPETSEASAEGCNGVGIIVGWQGRHNCFGCIALFGRLVFKNGCCSSVVEGYVWGALVGSGCHVVSSRSLVCFDQYISGLAGT